MVITRLVSGGHGARRAGDFSGKATVDYTLVCASGAYAYTGVAATLTVKRNYVLTCAAGAYTYTGVAATLTFKHNYTLTCSAGAYAYSGVAATLIKKTNYALSCAAGAYAYTGVAATLTYVDGSNPIDYVLTCDSGSYAYSGKSATLLYVSGASENSGGYLPYKNHPWLSSPIKRYIREVEPEIVEAVIEVVAKAVEKRTVQNKDVEAAQAEKALRERLASQHQAWKEMYAQLILLEYERLEQEYEDAQIAMLLFDM